MPGAAASRSGVHWVSAGHDDSSGAPRRDAEKAARLRQAEVEASHSVAEARASALSTREAALTEELSTARKDHAALSSQLVSLQTTLGEATRAFLRHAIRRWSADLTHITECGTPERWWAILNTNDAAADFESRGQRSPTW